MPVDKRHVQHLGTGLAHRRKAGGIANIRRGEQTAKWVRNRIEFDLAQPEIELPRNRRMAIFHARGFDTKDAPLLRQRLLGQFGAIGIVRAEHAHRVETLVRCLRGNRSDRAQRRQQSGNESKHHHAPSR
ncbi:hypothetical protein D9M73_157220 [compost metagenome]